MSEPQNENAASPTPPPYQIVVKTGGTGSRMLAWMGWIGFIFCFLYLVAQFTVLHDYLDNSGGVTEQLHSGTESAKNKIAVISVTGVIMQGDGFVKQQIDRVRADKSVKAVVLRLNTPGGTVTGSDYLYHHLKRLRKEREIPIVVSMGSIAASGGYYIAMSVGDQKQSIYAEPTTTTGSIGVIVPHYDVSGLLEKYNIKDDSILSHERKQMLAMTRPIKPEHRKILQDYVDQAFQRFKQIVHEGRSVYRDQAGKVVDPKSGRDLATGEIFTAAKAKEYGLIDEIGFIEDAIARAKELADLKDSAVRVVKYKRPVSLMNLTGFASASKRPSELEMLLDLTTPRAYFLASSFPPLVSTMDR